MSTLERILSLHAQRYPDMGIQDYVKLLYQSEFGPGHLAGSPEEVLARLEEEFTQAQAEGYAPAYLVEAIGDGLCRFHLDPNRLTRADLPLLGRCFSLSCAPRGTLAGLWHKLGQLSGLTWAGKLPLDLGQLEDFLSDYDSRACPPLHHSQVYRDAYRPHYRVIDRDLACYAPGLQAIDRALREIDGPVLVSIDGRCASGKSTFAARCAQLFDCNVFHMDDFFLPAGLRTSNRLSAPGGNIHYERAAEELFAPLSQGRDVTLRSFDCATGTLNPPKLISFRRLNLIEGSYALHPALAGFSQLHLFLTCSPQVQLDRLSRREDPEKLQQFVQQWVPLEEAYFQGLSIESQCDVTIDTSRLSL